MTLLTGIETLDRKLDGGIPAGSLVAILVPPGVQHDPLLCAGAHERDSLVFTTIKDEPSMRKTFERSPYDAQIDDIVELDVEDAATVLPDRVEGLDEEEDFYLDVVDPVEERLNEGVYIDLLNRVSERLDAANCLGYLYGYAGMETSSNRRYTLDLADFVIELGTIQQRSQLDYYLEIPKASGVTLPGPDRFLEIEVGRKVDIDETRNI
jgi:hypothetical protein